MIALHNTTWICQMGTSSNMGSIRHILKLQWTLVIACLAGLCTLTFGLFLRTCFPSSALTFSLRSVMTPIRSLPDGRSFCSSSFSLWFSSASLFSHCPSDYQELQRQKRLLQKP
uniref:Uncharacterized protein n=1 Tax=Arundo donax TaxID=35708 RepID=A0A0A9H4I5_ARUDO